MATAYAPAAPQDESTLPPRRYAWLVFGCIVALLLSDYMSRQVLNACFPLLKLEWLLTDTELGSLASIVALMVGLLTVPLSMLADRWGRVRSIVLMAALWSLATMACALAASYQQMLLARFCVGVGEAAYGSVGIALILSIFPARLRATLAGAFMAGAPFGSVLGMALGGAIAKALGWRWAFGAMAIFGFALVLIYMVCVSEKRIMANAAKSDGKAADASEAAGTDSKAKARLRLLVGTRSVLCAYAGSGLQLFVMGAVLAWMPSFLNRYYQLDAARAGGVAAIFVMLGGAGMLLCGAITDRLSRKNGHRKWDTAISYCLLTCTLLGAAFSLPTGPAQLVLLGLGMLFAAGSSGAAGAMVANLTPSAVHAAAFAVLTLVNNLLGMAPGPFMTGVLADRIGLAGALQLVPLMALAAAILFWIGRRSYEDGMAHLAAQS